MSQNASSVAAVVLAYNDPRHARRLLAAMKPIRVIVHCDARAPQAVYDAMRQGATDNIEFLPRMRTGWAKFACVEAELAGIREALERRETEYVITMTGSDYPLVSVEELLEVTQVLGGRSQYWRTPIPHGPWIPDGGLRRFRYRHWSVGRQLVWLPVPRRLPAGVVPHASTLWKVLSRRHAELLLEVIARRPDIPRFWKRVAIPEESFIASVLASPALVGPVSDEVVASDPWYVRWPALGEPSPEFLTPVDLPDLLAVGSAPAEAQKLFARKFSSTSSSRLTEMIDAELRSDKRRAAQDGE
jgi:hypothetical protein